MPFVALTTEEKTCPTCKEVPTGDHFWVTAHNMTRSMKESAKLFTENLKLKEKNQQLQAQLEAAHFEVMRGHGFEKDAKSLKQQLEAQTLECQLLRAQVALLERDAQQK